MAKVGKKPYILYPVTIERMACVIKELCDEYIAGGITTIEFEASLRDLLYKRNRLFINANTIRWIGKKRMELIASILGQLQYTLV
jgi:hypothetical protein